MKAHSYENALSVTGKMPVLLASSCLVVAIFAMGVGISDHHWAEKKTSPNL
jgi:hypothetical protein